MPLRFVSVPTNSTPSPHVCEQRAWYTTRINLQPAPAPQKKPKSILSMCQDSRTITIRAYVITFLPVTMKKVPYQALFPTLSTRAGVAVALVGLTRRGSKRYEVVRLSAPQHSYNSCLHFPLLMRIVLHCCWNFKLLLLCSSAMFSAFLRSPG